MPILCTKKVMAFKQVEVLNAWKFFGHVLTLREIYCANSPVIFNRENGFWNVICLSGHYLLFPEKKLWILEFRLTVLWEFFDFFKLHNQISYEKFNERTG